MLKRRLLNFLLRKLFNAANEHDVLIIRKVPTKPTVVILGGIERPDGEELSRQARTLLKLDAYKLVSQSLKARVNKMMYVESKCDQDLVAGKMALWFMDIFQKTFEELAKIDE